MYRKLIVASPPWCPLPFQIPFSRRQHLDTTFLQGPCIKLSANTDIAKNNLVTIHTILAVGLHDCFPEQCLPALWTFAELSRPTLHPLPCRYRPIHPSLEHRCTKSINAEDMNILRHRRQVQISEACRIPPQSTHRQTMTHVSSARGSRRTMWAFSPGVKRASTVSTQLTPPTSTGHLCYYCTRWWQVVCSCGSHHRLRMIVVHTIHVEDADVFERHPPS